MRIVAAMNAAFAPLLLTAALWGLSPQAGAQAPSGTAPRPLAEGRPVSSPQEARELAAAAARAVGRQDWSEAQHLFATVLEREPGNPLHLANAGYVEYQLGDYRAAIAYLTEALAKKPDLHGSREVLGMACYRSGQLHRALGHLALSAADQPQEARVHNQLAVVLQGLGWLLGAERSLREAIRLDPAYAEAHYNLALVYMEQPDPPVALARRHYQKARALDMPPDPELETAMARHSQIHPETDSQSAPPPSEE